MEAYHEEPNVMHFSVRPTDIGAHCNPLSGTEWDCDPIDPALVLDAVKHEEFLTEDWQTVNRRNRGLAFDHFKAHVRRMAFLYANPDDTPIELEIDRWENRARLRVYDGNHRLGSAIIRGDQDIVIRIPADDVETFLTMIPAAEPVAPKTAGLGL
jgi:hypothetical protein